jgi:hypothetical protein
VTGAARIRQPSCEEIADGARATLVGDPNCAAPAAGAAPRFLPTRPAHDWHERVLDARHDLANTVATQARTGEDVGQGKGNLVRLAPLTGLVFAGLLLAGALVSGNTPDSNWSGPRVVAFYVSH